MPRISAVNAVSWLEKLIAFDTTSTKSNLALIETIADYLDKLGFALRLTKSPHEPKANLLASLLVADADSGMVLSGHTDTVPVVDQHWDTNPYQAKVIDDKVFGRGACDMKGFLAVLLAIAPQLTKSSLKQSLHFAFSFNEEIGCDGAPLLIQDMQTLGMRATACIVGEPTNMQPVIAHKGIQSFQCDFHGKAAHSSLTSAGCNAIYYASDFVQYIRDYAQQLQLQKLDNDFDIPYTTMSLNQIQGGSANNVIPGHCEVNFEFRNLPQDDPQVIENNIRKFIGQQLIPKIQKEHGEANIHLQKLASIPAFSTLENNAFYRQVQQILGVTEIHKVGFATEAGLFQQAGLATIVCGPGSIKQAHGANEYVTIEQLELCEKFLLQLVCNM